MPSGQCLGLCSLSGKTLKMLWSGAGGIVIDQVLTKTYVFYLIMNDKVNYHKFQSRSSWSRPHVTRPTGNKTPWKTTIMATRGIASSIPGISSFSSSGNSFSIKNLLNLSDGAVEQQKWISKDGASVNVFDPQCSTPPLLVAPRAMFPLGYHRPLLSPSLPVGIFSLPPSRSATQITPFNFPSHVCSPGKYVGKKDQSWANS